LLLKYTQRAYSEKTVYVDVKIYDKDQNKLNDFDQNYGFISDGALSIDNKFGIEVSVGDDINVLTNDRSINLNTDNGNINLGNVELESLVRGETLLGLMEELIDAITQQIYLTPSGPSATGPTNVATFNSIKSKLKNFLSTLNKTS